MRRLSLNHHEQNGFILVTLLVATFFIMLTGVVTTQLVLSNLQVAANEQNRLNAQFSADAAIDHAIQEINQDHTWAGTVGEQTLYEDSKVKVTYESTVVDDSDPFIKYIDVIGRTYSPKTDTTAKNTRQYRAELRGVGGGNYSLVTGVGGLTLKNSSHIVDGSVYVNGRINMSNTSTIGLSIIPVDVKVAHQICPVYGSPNFNAEYPRVCNSGENGQPISISNSAHIYGPVLATNQTDGSKMSSPGLQTGNPPAISLPNDHDREAQKAAVAHEVSGSSAGCSLGIKTWKANTKINGNVSVSSICVVTVEGDIWITGNFDIKNIGVLKVQEGLSQPPVIMIDGSNGLTMRNAGAMLPNLFLKGFRVITYYSAAPCSPDCTSVTGTNLYNSQSHVTIDLAQSANAAFTEFYSRWSKIDVSNSGNVGALVGQEIEMSNSAAITFGVSVSGLNTPNAWVLRSYKRVF